MSPTGPQRQAPKRPADGRCRYRLLRRRRRRHALAVNRNVPCGQSAYKQDNHRIAARSGLSRLTPSAHPCPCFSCEFRTGSRCGLFIRLWCRFGARRLVGRRCGLWLASRLRPRRSTRSGRRKGDRILLLNRDDQRHRYTQCIGQSGLGSLDMHRKLIRGWV